jgi:hypothetical protein
MIRCGRDADMRSGHRGRRQTQIVCGDDDHRRELTAEDRGEHSQQLRQGNARTDDRILIYRSLRSALAPDPAHAPLLMLSAVLARAAVHVRGVGAAEHDKST